METTETTDYDQLEADIEVDVAVLGGGITGITTAAELTDAGKSVAVVERDRIVESVTGHTTAKLTSLHGLRYDHLIDHFGEEQARQYAEANQSAIDYVESTAAEHDIDCHFERRPAYTYSRDDREQIEDEVDAAQRLNLPASFEESTDLPFETAAAIRLDSQALFHPRKYLLGLAETIPDDDSYVFENTTATDVEDGSPCTVSTDGGTITADAVVVATHFPVFDKARYYERLYPKRSYVLAVRLKEDVPRGMYYNPEKPYFSVRPAPAGDGSMALVGGQNHRTGHGGNVESRYEALRQEASDRFDIDEVVYRWSTQDYVSVDGVPFIGPIGSGSENVYAATGFGGWGMSNGIVAGKLLSDLMVTGESPLADVFHPIRFNEDASRGDFCRHNVHDVSHYLEDYNDYLQEADVQSIDSGEGKVLQIDGEPVAVSRDEDGLVHAASAICTHMGCLVHWNADDQSWDCPCHGSRFDRDGDVLNTPANSGLPEHDLE